MQAPAPELCISNGASTCQNRRALIRLPAILSQVIDFFCSIFLAMLVFVAALWEWRKYLCDRVQVLSLLADVVLF